MAATTEMESQDAARMRSSLGLANEMIVAANEIAMAYPNPHIEISRLTHLLKDGEFIQRFPSKGLRWICRVVQRMRPLLWSV